MPTYKITGSERPEPIRPGWYDASVDVVDALGVPNEGSPYYDVHFRIEDYEEAAPGRTIRNRYFVSEAAIPYGWTRFLTAIGLIEPGEAAEFDTDTWDTMEAIARPCRIRVIVSDRGEDYREVDQVVRRRAPAGETL